jgi:hypothetical protein
MMGFALRLTLALVLFCGVTAAPAAELAVVVQASHRETGVKPSGGPAARHKAQKATLVQTATAWGLIGRWSLDCSLPPDRNRGTVLAYEIVPGNRLVHRRYFGDATEENEVLGAEASADGMLNLRVFFPSLKQTREYGLMKQPDGSIRAMYNRDRKGEYTIRDGVLTASGDPTPAQHKCS